MDSALQTRELQLIQTCREIGSIAGWNGPATAGFVRWIGDRQLQDMTIGELIQVSEQYSEFQDRMYK